MKTYAGTKPFNGDFRNFIHRAWEVMGLPEPTDIQYDFARFIQCGPDPERDPFDWPNSRIMGQGFRGLAKSTITACFAPWNWLEDQDRKILIVSSAIQDAGDMSTLIMQLLEQMPECEHLLPEAHQRKSKLNFDVRGKAPAKAPSLKSRGVMGQLVGTRANVIIGDDIEAEHKAYTQGGRERIESARRQFDAIIHEHGRIILLGTPQTEQSVYNELPEKGFHVYVWPARYPSPEAAEEGVDSSTDRPTKEAANRGQDHEREDRHLLHAPAAEDLTEPALSGATAAPLEQGRPYDAALVTAADVGPLVGDDTAGARMGLKRLAPLISRALLLNPGLAAGSLSSAFSGLPTEPSRFDDSDLLARELSWGRSGFALQYMLDTRLSDANRYPLRLRDLIVLDLDLEDAPDKLVWASSPDLAVNDVPCVGFQGDRYYRPMSIGKERFPYAGKVLFIDPSGRGKDETAWAVVKQLHGKLYVADVVGLPGGYERDTLERIAKCAKIHKVDRILVESNFGDGMFTELLNPVLRELYPITVEEVHHHGQKERRIIDTLEPAMNQHRIVIDKALVLKDSEVDEAAYGTRAYAYQLLWQLTRITKDRACLPHDDRLEALAGAVNYFTSKMRQSEGEAAERSINHRLAEHLKKFTRNAFFGNRPRAGKKGVSKRLRAFKSSQN